MSCPASVLRHFHEENPRKRLERQKNMQTGMGAVEGDASMRKKFRAIWRSKKKVVGNPPLVDRKRAWLHWGYVIACMQLHQIGRTCGHGLCRAPRKVGMKTDTKLTLGHVRPVFYGIFTRKILGNASSVGKICKLALVLWRVMPACGKSFVPFGGVKKSSRKPPSGRP